LACDTAWHELIVGGERFAATARSKTASFVPVWIVEESGGGTTGAGWWCAGAVEAAGEGWMIEIEGEAAGLGRQRHGAGAEVAAPGALHTWRRSAMAWRI
jgi:hypothetical protein